MTYTLYVAMLLLVGLAGGKIASKLNLPSVTGYILSGLILGPSVLNIVDGQVYNSLSFVNELALGILALSVGTELHRDVVKKFGRNISVLSFGNTILTFTLVTVGTYLAGMQLSYALVLGALAMTVSPSGVVSMVKETKAQGEMSQTLLGLVAFDNLITIIVFGVIVALVQTTESQAAGGVMMIVNVFLNVLYAVIGGAATGAFVSFFIRRDTSNEKLLVILLGVILCNSGIATVFGLSPILINIICGVAVVNLTNRKVLVTTVLNRVELPIFVIFLTLAGAHLDVAIFATVGLIGLVYIICRAIGKSFGTFFFARFTTLSKTAKNNIGLCVLPQAGVAIGLATIAEQSIPGAMGILTGVVLTGVVVFEIVGPLLLGRALKNSGEVS